MHASETFLHTETLLYVLYTIFQQPFADTQSPLANMHSSETFLHTETGLCNSSSLPCQSMLESIDKKGGSIAVGVEFCVLVQRVFKKRVKNTSRHSRY